MKIALFNTMASFVRGGAEILVDDLYDQLVKRKHNVTLFRIPFPNSFEVPLMELVYAAENLNFDAYDVVIAFKFPAYCAVHRNKVLWFFHQFRQVYDLFGKEYGLADDDTGNALKEIIKVIDNDGIGNAAKVFTNAQEVTDRLKKYNGLDSIVLNPPLQNYENYYCKGNNGYVYYPSRITRLKRQHLAIEAMRYVKTDVKLVIHGKCSEPEYFKELDSIINKYDLKDKVLLKDEWISDEKKISTMADSMAVMYIPYKEDSCGFVTMEGFYSSKPVISCYDSGGTKEFIDHDVTGLFADPTPESLAECMDKLYLDKEKAEKMGKAAYKEIIRRNITWDSTIGRLLG